MDNTREIQNAIDHCYRNNSGKLIAILTQLFGPSNLELAEDVVHDAMVEALNNWQQKGIPGNPAAWLMRTAKNKALNIIRRDKYKFEYAHNQLYLLQNGWTAESFIEEMFTEREIKDELLRMMFVCCHPDIGKEAQVTLILKTLCGFSIAEIARAYLTTEATISKRLVRARQTIRELDIAFEIPANENLQQRVDAVLETIYLLFNEGYSSTEGDVLIRFDICEEAIRLCKILGEHPAGNNSSTWSLLSLMCLNASRFNARVAKEGNAILLHEQDRSLWNRELIRAGLKYLEAAAGLGIINTYYIQAAISACHCIAPDYEQTNWTEILNLYNLLIKIDNSPVVLLNRVVALSKIHGQQAALNELDSMAITGTLENYYPFYAVKGELLMELSRWKEAKANFEKARSLTLNQQEQDLLSQKIIVCADHVI